MGAHEPPGKWVRGLLGRETSHLRAARPAEEEVAGDGHPVDEAPCSSGRFSVFAPPLDRGAAVRVPSGTRTLLERSRTLLVASTVPTPLHQGIGHFVSRPDTSRDENAEYGRTPA